mgnify:CR=1 FL=1
MKNEYTYLLRLLGAYLREEAPAPAADVDWAKLLELSRIHSVIGIVGFMGRKYPICPDPQFSGGFRSLALLAGSGSGDLVHDLDNDEHHHGHDQEIDHCCDKLTISECDLTTQAELELVKIQ